jgi:hypothetical protein
MTVARQRIFTLVLGALAVLPLAGQPILQRMESDAKERAAPAALATAPLIDTEAVVRIAMTNALGGDVTRLERRVLSRLADRLRLKNAPAAQQDWERLIGAMQARGAEVEVDELSNWVVHRVYLERSPAFKPLLAAMRFRDEQRTAACGSQTQLEQMSTRFETGETAGRLTIRPIELVAEFESGVRPVVVAESKPATAESVAEELSKAVALCHQATEGARMATVDFENALKQQQETLQEMSNASKMLHDTADAILGKIN